MPPRPEDTGPETPIAELRVPLTPNEYGMAREAARKTGTSIEQWAHAALARIVRTSH